MSDPETKTRSVVIEREVAFPPEKIWRALTQPHLIAEWLMKNDFAPALGHRFTLSQEWGSIDCQVLTIEAHRTLAYSWGAMGLESVVTWTLTPTPAGTHLRLEQRGFKPDQKQAFGGAQLGWRRFLDNLDQLLARLD
jgi:uncharacterized protein YndB with AHSA1/START domain